LHVHPSGKTVMVVYLLRGSLFAAQVNIKAFKRHVFHQLGG
jgi:hypothetical protein